MNYTIALLNKEIVLLRWQIDYGFLTYDETHKATFRIRELEKDIKILCSEKTEQSEVNNT